MRKHQSQITIVMFFFDLMLPFMRIVQHHFTIILRRQYVVTNGQFIVPKLNVK